LGLVPPRPPILIRLRRRQARFLHPRLRGLPRLLRRVGLHQ
jgi:hypothetical protein